MISEELILLLKKYKLSGEYLYITLKGSGYHLSGKIVDIRGNSIIDLLPFVEGAMANHIMISEIAAIDL